MRIADCGLRIADLFLKPAILCATIVSFIILTGCAKESATTKGEIVGCDDFGRKIVLPKSPERIVVISGSPIDAIFELGAGERIVAVQDS
ncbi:hypothetical protein KKH56_08475, partial [bacterium]|nr:hypothetical protein [bacterium]